MNYLFNAYFWNLFKFQVDILEFPKLETHFIQYFQVQPRYSVRSFENNH